MVVLSASVCTTGGNALVSRQFVEMDRIRVEGLFAAFPKLLASHSSRQHTYAETGSVRYVYQPLENKLYLLLITNKASNIVEDLCTLRLLAKVLPEVCGCRPEKTTIRQNAFELIFAFDEILTAGGYKEEVTLSGVRRTLLMDSQEERFERAKIETKKHRAKESMEAHVKEIQKRQLEQMWHDLGITSKPAAPPSMEGFGNSNGTILQGAGSMQGAGPPACVAQQQPHKAECSTNQPDTPAALARTGMVLRPEASGTARRNDQISNLIKEDKLCSGLDICMADESYLELQFPPVPIALPSVPLSLLLEESISAKMTRDGAVLSCEVRGHLQATAHTDVGSMATVTINKPSPLGVTYATHPKVDKARYAQEGKLALRNQKAFPVGRSVNVLRWSYKGNDAVPLLVTCWPEDDGTGSIYVHVAMELIRTDLVLTDVNIWLPLGNTDPPPNVENVSSGAIDKRTDGICWHFDRVDGNTNARASIEFTFVGRGLDAFFPIRAHFQSQTLLYPIEIVSADDARTGMSIPYDLGTTLSTDSYEFA